MQAGIGDRLHVHGRTVGEVDHAGEIVEVRGESGHPPYLVRWLETEHESLLFPGPDARVEPATQPT